MKNFIVLMAMAVLLSACAKEESSICTMTLNTKSAKDNISWQGKYTEKINCNQGKCGQVRHLTLNKDETFSYELITNGKSQYVEQGKFTWESNDNIVNIGRYRFYVNKNAVGYVFKGDTPNRMGEQTICMVK